ncbi:unnamed protein product, partial [Amoebophrya sp. A120]
RDVAAAAASGGPVPRARSGSTPTSVGTETYDQRAVPPPIGAGYSRRPRNATPPFQPGPRARTSQDLFSSSAVSTQPSGAQHLQQSDFPRFGRSAKASAAAPTYAEKLKQPDKRTSPTQQRQNLVQEETFPAMSEAGPGPARGHQTGRSRVSSGGASMSSGYSSGHQPPDGSPQWHQTLLSPGQSARPVVEDLLDIFKENSGSSTLPSDALVRLWQTGASTTSTVGAVGNSGSSDARGPQLSQFFFLKKKPPRSGTSKSTTRDHAWVFELLEEVRAKDATKAQQVFQRLLEAAEGNLEVVTELCRWKGWCAGGASPTSVLEVVAQQPIFWRSQNLPLHELLNLVEKKAEIAQDGDSTTNASSPMRRGPNNKSSAGNKMKKGVKCPTVSTKVRQVDHCAGAAEVEPFVLDVLQNGTWRDYIATQLRTWAERLATIDSMDEGSFQYNTIERWHYCCIQWRPRYARSGSNGSSDEGSASGSSNAYLGHGAEPEVEDAPDIIFESLGYGTDKFEAETVGYARVLEQLGLCRDFLDIRKAHLQKTLEQGVLHFLPAIFWER